MKKKSFRKNFYILIPILILLVLSLFNMYGASYISHFYDKYLIKQGLWILIGFLVMFLIYKIDLKMIINNSQILYALGIVSLILVLFFGINVNGATSWFKIGPFSFQPSELFKVLYLLYLAKIVDKSRKKDKFLIFKIIFLTFLPCILIFLEPDTGVVLMYLLMMLGIMFASKVEKKYIILLFLTGIVCIGGFFAIYFLDGDLFIKLFGTSFFYRIDRLLSFKESSSYQLNQALIGIGSSGLTGFGLKSSKIYIPEVTTDFVFDLTICNFGWLMGIFVTSLYVFILFIIYRESINVKKKSERCILLGTFYMMLFQVGEHILMNIGLTPITGITLPFLSYGGSSLISYFLIFGLILKITTNNSSYS